MTEKRLFTEKQAAHYLGIGRTTLYELVKEGQLKCVYIKTRKLYDRRELDRFVDSLCGMGSKDRSQVSSFGRGSIDPRILFQHPEFQEEVKKFAELYDVVPKNKKNAAE